MVTSPVWVEVIFLPSLHSWWSTYRLGNSIGYFGYYQPLSVDRLLEGVSDIINCNILGRSVKKLTNAGVTRKLENYVTPLQKTYLGVIELLQELKQVPSVSSNVWAASTSRCLQIEAPSGLPTTPQGWPPVRSIVNYSTPAPSR